MVKPSPRQVAERLLILKYQIVHAMTLPPKELLQVLSNADKKILITSFKERKEQLTRFFKVSGLWKKMTNEERRFLASSDLAVNTQQHLNALWLMESAVVLMWSMRLMPDFPAFNVQTDTDLLRIVPVEDIKEFINNAQLVSNEEIHRKRSLAELWHWRSKTRQLMERREPFLGGIGCTSYEEIIKDVVYRAHGNDDISNIIDNDFAVNGKAYKDLTVDEWAEIRSITMERHRALNWLCGYAPGNRWDQTPTDT